ncbi:uncharacterized protein Z520_12403 [Fonsecaea multimorphosa CBS 102226]|uniref:Only prolin and serin are matching in the corresponding protein n=1 Tax=Fonsecaea multimorphosa CBS 102226 TaxID=1442371 RepID=A0A0D2I3N0_9EURO|nr:uncharacterized protein Z520_12403 [Fonsecaea multimorphosa CBS 102226]KIX91891.1 hypothetical protein Z520_12403 [Fonsecaea multimorphosa CBS 102226]OAL20780.1 hypothetical protein AYO22_08550 [Fonsecaea multimorphosa]
MEHTTLYPFDTLPPATRSSASSVDTSSPTVSMFSKGHSSRGSNSSAASSPVPRESLDMFGGAKRLEDVTEEPQERDESDGYTLVNDGTCDWSDYDKAFSSDYGHASPPTSPIQPDWILAAPNDSSASPQPYHTPRRRSTESPSSVQGHRFSSKFGSISRRWRNRSAAGPQLSIVTHMSASASRSGSLSSSQICSPALSAVSRHESGLPSSSVVLATNETTFDADVRPINIEQKTSQEHLAESVQATTPLLPPMFSEYFGREEPVHSPLQSPAIAPTPAVVSSRPSFDAPLSCMPSPPLSTKPSMVSMHSRSRANTMNNSPFGEIPPLQLLEDPSDPWAVRLGHANYTIHPEPYTPETLDLDSYTEFRKNWDQARTHYAKHITRTAEHYGSTSKVYKLTEEKWASIDDTWKRQHDLMRTTLAPLLARLSGDSETQGSTTSSSVLEKPLTRVAVPVIDDKSGKFPKLGDGEIVGPMSVAPPRDEIGSPPVSPHKRNLLRVLSDVFRH